MTTEKKQKNTQKTEETNPNKLINIDRGENQRKNPMDFSELTKNIMERSPSIDMRNIEEKMAYLEKLPEINDNIRDLKDNINSIFPYAKIFLGLGSAAILLYLIKTFIEILQLSKV